MDHVLSVSLRLCVELERRFIKNPELSEGTLERSGLGHPLRSRTSGTLYFSSCLLLLLDLTSKHQQNSQMLRNKMGSGNGVWCVL
jgi:hypothetical protein